MNPPTRREFLSRAASLAALLTRVPGTFLWPLLGAPLRAAVRQDHLPVSDDAIILEFLGGRRAEELARLPIGELVAAVGRSFLGSPYRPNTLEEGGDEHLVVNLREFDCVTLCESSLALARAISMHARGADGYRAQLELIRYRGGVLRGYPSRLHYFSEWIADNRKKGIVTDVTRALGGIRDGRPLTFMTSHRESYPRLADGNEYDAIEEMEKRLGSLTRYVLGKDRVEEVQDRIHDGDIIAIATSVSGLDVSHTGIAVREGGTTRLLHAPNIGQRVEITHGSLASYLRSHGTQTGIIIARPREPHS